jgi:hypothetical protein
MATASVDRGMLWTDLEGKELPGGWRLKRLARPEGRNAWFEAVGTDGKPAMVSLTEALNDEEGLLARLRAAAAIHHPNVVAVRDARLAWVCDTPLVIAAMEPTDENLAEVLRERALEPDEARLLLDGLLQGLAAIHARRLTHGRMEAGSVLATGNTVKLRSDCLHLDGFTQRAAEDLRGAGRIVTQALTRRIPANENDPVLQLVPEPMGRAVRRALSGNATVEEVAALAGTRVVKALDAMRSSSEAKRAVTTVLAAIRKPERAKSGSEESGPMAETPQPTAMPAAQMHLGRTATTPQMDLPLIARCKEEPEARDEEDDEKTPVERLLDGVERLMRRWRYHRRGAPWVVAGAAGLAFATALLLHGWLHPAVKAAAPAPRAVVERASPAVPVAVVRPAGAKNVWRVVVYTYRRRSEAEQRVRDLAGRYPQLQAGVMATRGGDFLVTVGGAMSRDEAMALRNRAVGMGLPRDAYAQNFQ